LFASSKEGIKHGCTLSPAVRSGKKLVLSAKGIEANAVFKQVIKENSSAHRGKVYPIVTLMGFAFFVFIQYFDWRLICLKITLIQNLNFKAFI